MQTGLSPVSQPENPSAGESGSAEFRFLRKSSACPYEEQPFDKLTALSEVEGAEFERRELCATRECPAGHSVWSCTTFRSRPARARKRRSVPEIDRIAAQKPRSVFPAPPAVFPALPASCRRHLVAHSV